MSINKLFIQRLSLVFLIILFLYLSIASFSDGKKNHGIVLGDFSFRIPTRIWNEIRNDAHETNHDFWSRSNGDEFILYAAELEYFESEEEFDCPLLLPGEIHYLFDFDNEHNKIAFMNNLLKTDTWSKPGFVVNMYTGQMLRDDDIYNAYVVHRKNIKNMDEQIVIVLLCKYPEELSYDEEIELITVVQN